VMHEEKGQMSRQMHVGCVVRCFIEVRFAQPSHGRNIVGPTEVRISCLWWIFVEVQEDAGHSGKEF